MIRTFLLFFVAVVPFEAVDIFQGFLSPAKIAGFLFFLSCIFYCRRCFQPPCTAVLFASAYLFVYLLNGFFITNLARFQFLSQGQTILQLILLLWLASSLLKDEKLLRSALLTFAFSAALLAALSFTTFPGFSHSIRTREIQGNERLSTLMYNPNDLAGVMAIAAIIFLGLRLADNSFGRWKNRAILIASLLPVALLVRTGSRAGIMAMVVGLLPFLLPFVREEKRKMFASFLAVFSLLLIVFFVARDPLSMARFEKTYASGDSAGRDEIFKAAGDMFLERPFSGWRPADFYYELGRRAEGRWIPRDAHNLFLHLLLEVGLIGTIPFLIAFGLCALAAWRARGGPFRLLPLALMLIVITVNSAHTWLGRKPMWLVMAFAVAAASATYKIQSPSMHRIGKRSLLLRQRYSLTAESGRPGRFS